MVELLPHDFLYTWNGSDMKAMSDFISESGGYIHTGYSFIDERFEHYEFDRMMDLVADGDTLYIPTIRVFHFGKVDDLKDTLWDLESRGIFIRSLEEPDYSCAAYTAALDVVRKDIIGDFLGPLREAKDQLTSEIAELEAKKEDILRRGGRPKKEVQIIEALALYRTERFKISEICELTGISRTSIFRALAEEAQKEDENDFENEE